MNAHAPPPTVDIAKRVGQYVALRDKIKSIKDRHKAELAPFNEALDQLNGMLLHHLDSIGSDSATTKGVGTVYRTMNRRASIADAANFRRYVIGAEAWDLCDWKANAPAVEAFIEEHKSPPPGVNFRTEYEVGVRRG